LLFLLSDGSYYSGITLSCKCSFLQFQVIFLTILNFASDVPYYTDVSYHYMLSFAIVSDFFTIASDVSYYSEDS
jgi:hypothetical protein